MGNGFLGRHKTDQALLDALRKAAKVKQTADELLEQRISFIYGSIRADSGVTRDRIRQALVEHDQGAAK